MQEYIFEVLQFLFREKNDDDMKLWIDFWKLNRIMFYVKEQDVPRIVFRIRYNLYEHCDANCIG